MAWGCVWKLKNSINEYYFAIIPPGYYTGPQPGGTIINQRAYRESNSETPGNPRYTEIYNLVEDISNQQNIERRGNLFVGLNTDYSVLDRVVYSDIGGSGVEYYIPDTSVNAGFSALQIMYKAFARTQTRSFSASFNKDYTKARYSFVVPMMFVNDETEEIYSAIAFCSVVSADSLLSFNYYDSAQITIYVADESSTYNLWDIFNGSIPSGGGGDPYEPGGISREGGSGGDFDESSDPIPVPPDPTISAASSGLVTIYNPTLPQMIKVANALLNPGILTALANNVVKLSDVIIGLSIFPLAIPDGGNEYIKVNLLGFQWNTGVSCIKAASQFIPLDCGKISLKEYWGSCLDYSPFTQVGIFLPYCGYFPLNVDEVMGHDIGVIYKIDLFSGQCIAFITVDDSVHYQFTGSCSTQVPISSQSYDGLMSALLEFATATGEFIGAGSAAIGHKNEMNGASDSQNYEEAKVAQKALDKKVDTSAGNLAEATLGVVMGSKPVYNKTGMIHGPAGFMGVQKPYINIIRPRQSLPEGYNTYEGYPSNITRKLDDLNGYTKVESIKLAIPKATALEKEAIVTLLQGGVIL